MSGVKTILCFSAVAAALVIQSAIAADEFGVPDKNSPELSWWRDSMKTHDERVAWWREAKFGMFVHWGVYSSLGNEYQGRKGGGYAEHIQRVLKIPIPEYRANVAGIFNPTNFDADEWIRTAKEAGMGYFIITSKHHDGFAMWPTKINDYNVMDATPWHRDPMADLRAACKKYGVKFGFYYSHAFDWGNSNAPGNDWEYGNPGGDKLIGGRNWWETTPAFLPKAKRYVDEKAIPQLRELIKLYDPDIFWFDTPSKLPDSENLRIMKAVRAASSRVVINGRIVRGLGDYASTADRPAEFSPHDGDWEGIPTTNESYGWNKFDSSHKPPSHFIQILAKAAARGGNILMNVGPMGDGRMDPKDVAILHGIGEWWKINGDSIRGTTHTPLPVQTWGESTRKGNTLYLHVFDWPEDGKLVVGGLTSDVTNAYLLAMRGLCTVVDPRGTKTNQVQVFNSVISSLQPGQFKIARLNPFDVSVMVPTNAPDTADSVVVLECAGDIQAKGNRLLQPGFSSDTLRVFDAQLHGKGIKFGPGKTRDAYVSDWTRQDEFISWPVRLNEAAIFDVEMTYDAEADSAGGAFEVLFGSQTLRGVVKSGVMQTASLGRVSLKPGNFEIKLAAGEIKGAELMRPRALTLKPVAESAK